MAPVTSIRGDGGLDALDLLERPHGFLGVRAVLAVGLARVVVQVVQPLLQPLAPPARRCPWPSVPFGGMYVAPAAGALRAAGRRHRRARRPCLAEQPTRPARPPRPAWSAIPAPSPHGDSALALLDADRDHVALTRNADATYPDVLITFWTQVGHRPVTAGQDSLGGCAGTSCPRPGSRDRRRVPPGAGAGDRTRRERAGRRRPAGSMPVVPPGSVPGTSRSKQDHAGRGCGRRTSRWQDWPPARLLAAKQRPVPGSAW